MNKMTIYFLEKSLDDGLKLDELTMLTKTASVYHQELFPVQVGSNNSVMYGFLPGSIMERTDFREDEFKAFLTDIMDRNAAPDMFSYKDILDVSVELFGEDLMTDELFIINRMLKNTCGFTGDMMSVVDEFLKNPLLLNDFRSLTTDLIEINSTGSTFPMTRAAYEAAALQHELNDAAEMARTALLAKIFGLAGHAVPENESEIKEGLATLNISEEFVEGMVNEVAHQFVQEHDSEFSDNQQMQMRIESAMELLTQSKVAETDD